MQSLNLRNFRFSSKSAKEWKPLRIAENFRKLKKPYEKPVKATKYYDGLQKTSDVFATRRKPYLNLENIGNTQKNNTKFRFSREAKKS